MLLETKGNEHFLNANTMQGPALHMLSHLTHIQSLRQMTSYSDIRKVSSKRLGNLSKPKVS